MATSRDPVKELNATGLKRRTDVLGGARQHGQSAIFVLLFLGVLLISLNFLYKQGRITSDKMELQNAADAIAYSISLTEARDLNFAAYLNRAMIANEVAIGQLLGLASWAQLVKSYGDFLNTWATPLLAVPGGAAVVTTIGKVAEGLKKGGGFIFSALSSLANYGTTFMYVSNQIYSYAQLGYHVATTFVSLGMIDELLDENAPPGTRISDYGVISLIAHLVSYGSPSAAVMGLAPNSGLAEQAGRIPLFVEFHHPSIIVESQDYADGEKGGAEAFERFASIVRDSRDPFTLDRGWDFAPFQLLRDILAPIPLLSVDDRGRINLDIEFEWELCEIIPGFPTCDIDITFLGTGLEGHVNAGIWADINFYFGLAVVRRGASELRLLIPSPSPSTAFFEAGTVANWSSADVAALDVAMGASIEGGMWLDYGIDICVLGVCDGFSGRPELALRNFAIDIADNQLTVTEPCIEIPGAIGEVADWLGYGCIPIPIGLGPIDFPTQAGLGASFTEAGIRNKNDLKSATMDKSLFPDPTGARPAGSGLGGTQGYGGAPAVGLGPLNVWELIGVPPTAFPKQGVRPANSPGLGKVPPGVRPRSDTQIGQWYGDKANRVNEKYPGLPGHVDTAGVDQTMFGFGAPQLTISLVLKEDDHDLDRAAALSSVGLAGNHPEMSGRLGLTERMAEGGIGGILGADPKLHTVGRSEVYFKRPNDLDWFKRLDGYEEIGSAFNPYWQARLTEMPYLNSVVALAVEQGEDFALVDQFVEGLLTKFNPITDLIEDIGLPLLVP